MKNGSADDTGSLYRHVNTQVLEIFYDAEKNYTAMHFVIVLLVPSDTSL